jgi:protein phosphatase
MAHGTLAGAKPGENQDAVAVAPLSISEDTTGVICAVADGVGSTPLAATAARSAVDAVVEYVQTSKDPPADALPLAALAAHEAVRRSTVDSSGKADGASTLVVAAVHGDRLHVVSAGDSRAYLCTAEGRLEQITTDHSWVQEQMKAGVLDAEAAAVHPWRSVITRYLGGELPPEVDLFERTLEPGAGFLLCSDGLIAAVPEAEVASIVGASDPESAVDMLLDLARQRQARDDVTLCIALTPRSRGGA